MRHVRLGVIVPSSNTVLEPLTSGIVASIKEPQVSVHYARVRVTKISLQSDSDDQFETSHFLEAAGLLADAGVDAIGWSGTSGGWLGFHTARELCNAIQVHTRIPCTTSTLALNELLQMVGKSFALVTPYTADMNDAICQNYRQIGVEVKHSQCLGLTENREIAAIDESAVDSMVDSVVREGASIVATFCTNLHAAQRVEHWERKYNIIILDSVATVVWGMLRLANVPGSVVKDWGKLFSLG